MTRRMTFGLGRINTNEDEAKVVHMPLRAGQAFATGDPLLVVETSKAAVEILAPSNGRMLSVFVSEGETLGVGQLVFEAEFENDPTFENLELHEYNGRTTEDGRAAGVGERKMSYKAEKLAKRLGLDAAQIPSAGATLKEADVSAYVEKNRLGVFAAPADGPKRFPQSTQCIVVGAGGHAKSLISLIRQAGYSISGVTDTKLPKGSLFAGAYPVLGTNDDFALLYEGGIRTAFLGVGGAARNDVRREVFRQLKAVGFTLPPLVSRHAFFDSTSSIGEATYVLPAASVGADCVIGVNCIVNQGSIICHDCEISDHAHLAPGAILAGGCVIGENTTIGMAATVMNGVTVGRDCLVHNSVAVASDVPSGATVTRNGFLRSASHAT